MEIKDLQSNQGNIDLVLTVIEKGDARTFEKFGKQGRVCSIKAKDDSGEIKMTLWNEDVDKVNQGDKIHLKNGWCSEYQGEKQISSGKFGEIEVLEKDDSQPETTPEEQEPAASPSEEPTEEKETSESEEETSEEPFTEEEVV